MNKNDLRPGDILLLRDEPSKELNLKHIGIRIGQAMTGMYRENVGHSSMVHAVIWIAEAGGPEIAEASGSCGQVQVRALQPGLYIVYRSKNSALGESAATLAVYFATEGHTNYSKGGAIQSGFHSASFGSKGKALAAQFGRDDFDPAQGFNGGAFCSEFVAACYQGAAGHMGISLAGALAVDAKHCSVRALQDKLMRDTTAFSWKGSVRQ